MPRRNALVSDFDGTITEVDFFTLIADKYMDDVHDDYFELHRQGKMTHVEAMQGFFQWAPTGTSELEELLRDTLPDAGLRESVERLEGAGWDLIVVSAGSSWYIERIFDALGIRTATVHANAGRIVEGQGLQIDTTRDVDKRGIVREAVSRYERVAFAGDGPPDLSPSLLVPSDRRFARRWLAEELMRRGESFRPFARWREVVDTLVVA